MNRYFRYFLRIFRIGTVSALVFSIAPIQVVHSENKQNFKDFSSLMAQPSCRPPDGDVTNPTFTSDGKYLVGDWPPKSIRVWNANTAEVVSTVSDTVVDYARKFAISADHKFLITWDNPGESILWDFVSGTKLRTLFSTPQTNQEILTVAFAPTGHLVLISTPGGHHLWNPDLGSDSIVLASVGEFGISSEFSPDGSLILTQSESLHELPKIRLWDVKTLKLTHTLEGINEAHFSPDGSYILAYSVDGPVVLHAATLNLIYRLDGTPRNWRFSPHSKYLLADEGQEAVILWDVVEGKALHKFTEKIGIPFAAFFPEEKTILFAQDSAEEPESKTTFSIRDIESGRELRTFTISPSLDAMQNLVLSPNGVYLVVASSNGILTAWDTQSGKPIHQYC